MKPNKSEIKMGWSVWMFFVFFLLIIILSFGSGYLTKTFKVQKSEGIDFSCFKIHEKECNATITIPSINQTIIITSNFDYIKVTRFPDET